MYLKFQHKKLSLLTSTLLMSGVIISGCSSDGGSSSASSVVVNSNVPSVLQFSESGQGTVALVSASMASLTSVDSTDVRTVTFSDTSSCSPKLTFTPNSRQVTVDGDAETFTVTAPAGNCLHEVSFSGDGITTSTSTSDVNVVQNAIVTVGLYDSQGVATTTVPQGGVINVKFSSPADWENVTGEQSYTVSSDTSGITYTNNPCALTAPQAGTCTVTATIGDSVATTEHIFDITPSSTSVPVDEDSWTFNVTLPGTFTFKSGDDVITETTLTIGGEPVTYTIENTGEATIVDLQGPGADAERFVITNPGDDSAYCLDIHLLEANTSCQFNLRLSDEAEADATYEFEVTGDNASNSPAILTVNTEADEASCSGDNPTCRVFVTEKAGSGDFQNGWFGGQATGIDGANFLCETDPNNPYNGTENASNFKAWVSTDTVNAKDNIGYEGTTTYVRVESEGGQVIANPGTLLSVDETNPLENSITVNNQNVWTGTNQDGTAAAMTCNNWTSGQNDNNGEIGNSIFTNSSWTLNNIGAPTCDNTTFKIYCFEKPPE